MREVFRLVDLEGVRFGELEWESIPILTKDDLLDYGNEWGCFFGWRREGRGVGLEIFCPIGAITFDGSSGGFDDGFADPSGVTKADLAFGGVDIDVDLCWIDFNEEKSQGMLAFHEGGVVAFAKGEIDRAVFDSATIEKDELLCS